MALKTVIVPDIGEVVLAKRKGTRNIRLTITARGQVRVGMPHWAPYEVGIQFAKSKTEWIQKQLQTHPSPEIIEGSRIGKAHRVHFIYKNSGKITARVGSTAIFVSSHLPTTHPAVQEKAIAAGERALAAESRQLLPQRLAQLAEKHGYSYKNDQIKKLTSRWGSCSSEKVITLSYYLIQLPWPLIDYVLIHELAHTRHMNHSASFWKDVQTAMPNAKALRKEIKSYKPKLIAY
jgi:predicted metal-dependent hydrolase